MKKKRNLTVFLLLGIFCTTAAQNLPQKKVKPYDTWIKSTDNYSIVKGILHDVQDSSIRISHQYKDDFATYHFRDIDQVKIRRKNNVMKGVLIGGGIGLITPFIANPGSGRDSDLTPLINAVLSVPFTIFGAAVGAGLGSLKITIPISGNRNNFEAYKSKLNYFAVNKNADLAVNNSPELQNIQGTVKSKKIKTAIGYEHESYIGIVNGPSFPIGDLNHDVMINNRNLKAKTGFSSKVINIGYRLKGKRGISFAYFQNQYNAQSGDPEEWWSLNGILIGPMYSYNIGKKFIFDIKPRIGLAGLAVNTDIDIQHDGSGLVFNPALGFRYNFHRRWCIISETGYFFSKQKIIEFDTKNFQSLNLGIGIAYRYK